MALVYVILSTLPCFAFLIASSEVQPAVDRFSCASFVTSVYLCSDHDLSPVCCYICNMTKSGIVHPSNMLE